MNKLIGMLSVSADQRLYGVLFSRNQRAMKGFTATRLHFISKALADACAVQSVHGDPELIFGFGCVHVASRPYSAALRLPLNDNMKKSFRRAHRASPAILVSHDLLISCFLIYRATGKHTFSYRKARRTLRESPQ